MKMLVKIMHIRVGVHFGSGCILIWGAIRVSWVLLRNHAVIVTDMSHSL